MPPLAGMRMDDGRTQAINSMPDLALNPDLMPSLRRLVRGLSALQWGLPLTLLICVQSAATDWLRPLGVFPPLLATSLLYLGLLELRHFQRQERVWIQSVERTMLFALINVGLSPFVYFWNRLPHEGFFIQMVGLLVVTCTLFLFGLNRLLQRLVAMLPDETLREDTRLFTSLNLNVITALLVLLVVYFVLSQFHTLPDYVAQWLGLLYRTRGWLLIFLILLPVAMTMTLIWKIKDVVLASVFRTHGTSN
jgi:hypothetical protein